jgi:hypothetical protein
MAKKAFALRLDEAMLSALQRWADDEFRSVNGQIEYLLHEALLQQGRLKKQSQRGPQESADSTGPETTA